MATRVGINGFGRIGRALTRRAVDLQDLEIVAVNDMTDAATLAYLLTYDSTWGRFGHLVEHDKNTITVDGRKIAVLAGARPGDVDWDVYGVDVVVEATGRYRDADDAALHLTAGAKKVLIAAPAIGADLTVVVGVNEDTYDPTRHDVVSAGSGTTNCLAPMVKVLHDAFGMTAGFFTTTHAYTTDQRLLDGPHKHLRHARSAAVNIIPTSTEAARTIGQVIPAVAGLLDGIATRVPVEDGSLTDLVAVVETHVSPSEINDVFRHAALSGPLAGVLRYSTDPIVSRDIVGEPASCVFDASLTRAAGTLVKVLGWYDNEWGYACRLADLALLLGRTA